MTQQPNGHWTPYSENSERAVLGACITDKSAYALAAAIIEADDFFFLRHSYIWQALHRLDERGDPIDLLTLQEELDALKMLQEVGGGQYITSLIGAAPKVEHIEVYAQHVRRQAIRRQMLAETDNLKAMAIDESFTTDDLIAAWDKAGLSFRMNDMHTRQSFSEIITEYWTRLERLVEHPEELIGLPSGFRDLDAITQGFQAPDLVILAGRPAMGKTSLMLSMAANILRFGARVGIMSLEMSKDQLANRFFSMETGINSARLRSGKISQQEYNRFVESAGRLSKWDHRLMIDDQGGVSPQYLRSTALEWMYTSGIDILFIDYLQRMNGGPAFKGRDSRVQEVSFIARELKSLAKELHIPVVALAQLSRGVETRQDKRPMLADLRESGEIEQEADIVAFLYRDAYYNENSEFPNQADIIIAKHRNGATGTLSLYFERTITKFVDGSRRQIDLGDM